MIFKEFFKGIKKGMTFFGNNITVIVNTFFLAIVYIIGVGITSILAKLFGKKFLDMKLNKKSKTYWKDLDLKKEPIENHYKQF